MPEQTTFSLLALWPGLFLALGALVVSIWVARQVRNDKSFVDRIGGAKGKSTRHKKAAAEKPSGR